MTKPYDQYSNGGPWRKVQARLGGDEDEYLEAWTDGTMIAFPEESMREICNRINETPFAPTCAMVSGNLDILGDPKDPTQYLGLIPPDAFVLRWDWYTGDNVQARVVPKITIDGQDAWAALVHEEAEIEGEEPAPQKPGPAVSEDDLQTINRHRRGLGMAPIDLAAGWGEQELRQMAETIRAAGRMGNPVAELKRRLMR